MKKLLLLCACLAIAATAVTAKSIMADPRVGGQPMLPMKDIVDNAVNSADHTTLVAAVKAAGLVETLKGKGPFTVFAPTNDAFENLPAGTVTSLLEPANKAQLTKVLTINNKVAIEEMQKLNKEFSLGKVNEAAYDTLANNIKKKDEALFCIIKADMDARYRNVSDMVDEMAIHAIGKFAVQDSIKSEERAVLDIAKQQL